MATQPPRVGSLLRALAIRALPLFGLVLLAVASAARLNHSSGKPALSSNAEGVSRSGGLTGLVFVGADNAVLLARAESAPAGARPAQIEATSPRTIYRWIDALRGHLIANDGQLVICLPSLTLRACGSSSSGRISHARGNEP